MKKRTSIAAAITFSFSLLPLATSPASANDRKSHAASLCTSASANLAVQQEGHIENSHTSSTITVVCPILRDTVASSADVQEVSVWMFDSNAALNISCTLQSRSESGAAVDSTTRNSAGSSGAILKYQFTMPLDSAVSGYYLMSCTIPPASAGARSGIVNYVTDEAE